MKTTSSVLILTSILVISLSACKSKKEETISQDVKKLKIIEAEFGVKPASIPFTVDTVWVENLLLHANITYLGGEPDLTFDLVFDGSWLKSYPPVAHVNIVSSPTTVKGKTTIKQQLVFDLAPLSGNMPFEVIVNGYKKNFRIGKLDME